MAMDCSLITSLTAFQSTNYSSKIDSFSRLGDRITRTLGAPMVNIEIHKDQINEAISIACEMFTKFVGYTEEYIIFNSNLYVDGVGIRMDQLFSITPYFNKSNQSYITVYVANSTIPATEFTSSSALSATYPTGIFQNQILQNTDYQNAITWDNNLSAYFTPSINDQNQYVNSFDYDVMDYRKVIDVYNFEEGSNNGVNSLFTIEQTLAQQTYFSYAMGNYGFDLISWWTLKNWLDVREKMLAQRRSYTFDPRTQNLVFYPPPHINNASDQFWGVMGCYVERPLRDVIKELWIYKYALATCKIMISNTRGKYTSTTLFGGGQINYSDLMSQGLAEKEKLEEELYSGGAGDSSPPIFMMG